MEKPKLIQSNIQEVKSTADHEKNASLKVDTKSLPKQIKTHQTALTQKEAVYLDVMRIVREEKIVIQDKQTLKSILNDSQVKKICDLLVIGFQQKKITLKETDGNKKKLTDTKLLSIYCLGLLNNWLRRDKRLNGTLVIK